MAGSRDPIGAARLGLVAVALVGGIALGCLEELPRGRSCGDGWWDAEFEGCDPSSDDRRWVDACRAQGFEKDAECDPNTCELRASEAFCAVCGDGVASGDEVCDGNDVRGATCPSGSGVVRCTDDCKLDYDLCPAVCGDGQITGLEECEPSPCGSDDDCGPNHVCYLFLNVCVPAGDGFGPQLDCAYYEMTAIGTDEIIDKPYASGTISRCTDDCSFGRDKCGFCGDGELDGAYSDRVEPDGGYLSFAAEFCDGHEAKQEDIEAYCEPLCVGGEPINADVVVLCEVECNANCTAFAPPDDIAPSNPESGCCLAKGSPCPLYEQEGVPNDLPCCSWAEHPEWVTAKDKCIAAASDPPPVSQVCR